MPFDIVLKDGLLVDGIHESFRGDLGIEGSLIAAIGPSGTLNGDRIVDCAGMVVSPGFVDAHSHGELVDLLADAEVDSLRLAPLLEGVTTQVVGNCGFSAFGGTDREGVSIEALRSHLGQLMGQHARVFAAVSDYAGAFAGVGHTQNLITLAGHGSLVAAGMRDGVRPEAAEVRQRAADLAEWGVCGLSAGLIYSHGQKTTTDDLVVAASALAGRNLPVVFHIRGETHAVLQSVAEAILVAERAEVPCHISHHKIAGAANWGLSVRTLELIDEARSRGLDVTLDVYPYTSSSTSLHALLPPSFVVDGRVRWPRCEDDVSMAARQLRQAMAEDDDAWENMLGAAGWSKIWIAAGQGCQEYVGSSLEEVAFGLGTDAAEAAMRLLKQAEGPVTVVFEALSPHDVRRIMAHEATMIGSDGIPLPGKPHQRWAGSHVEVLGSYVREQSVLSLEQAIYKMSGFPARRFGLERHGELAEGFAADLVVFDPERVGAGSTRMEPLKPPTGIQTVLINGQFALSDGVQSVRRLGRFLRSQYPSKGA